MGFLRYNQWLENWGMENDLILAFWFARRVSNHGIIRLQITSVTEYPMHESRSSNKEDHLYVIISYVSKRDSRKSSFISFCHPRTSKVIYTLTTGDKVLNIECKRIHHNLAFRLCNFIEIFVLCRLQVYVSLVANETTIVPLAVLSKRWKAR